VTHPAPRAIARDAVGFSNGYVAHRLAGLGLDAMMRPMRSRLALLLGSIVFSILLVEGGLRVHYRATASGSIEDLVDDRPMPRRGAELELGDLLTMSPDPGVIYQGRPGVAGTHDGIAIRINRAGWREQDISFEKPPGTRRIVGIGDSVMFGWGVEESQRYLDVLEARLQRELPDQGWQTVALAMPGYNLMNELEVLRRIGARYEPDVVLYGYVQNDVCLPRFVAEPLDVASQRSFIAHYVRQGFSWQSPRLGWGDVVEREDGERRPWCVEEKVPERYRNLVGEERLRGAILELAAWGSENEVPVVILFDGRRGEPNPFAEFVPAGIVISDLYETFERYYESEDLPGYRHPRLRLGGEDGADNHPTAEAHRVIAEGLFDMLLGAGILAP
jgi:lysophospholipase L1-like esterase